MVKEMSPSPLYKFVKNLKYIRQNYTDWVSHHLKCVSHIGVYFISIVRRGCKEHFLHIVVNCKTAFIISMLIYNLSSSGHVKRSFHNWWRKRDCVHGKTIELWPQVPNKAPYMFSGFIFIWNIIIFHEALYAASIIPSFLFLLDTNHQNFSSQSPISCSNLSIINSIFQHKYYWKFREL